MLTTIKIGKPGLNSVKTIRGNLLGLITDKQYAVISKKPELHRKLITGELTNLTDVTKILLEDPYTIYRLMVNVKSVDGVVKDKHMFITDRLTTLTKCCTNFGKPKVEVWADDNTRITMAEEG